MSARLNPVVYRKAAKFVDRHLCGCCGAIAHQLKKSREYRELFAELFSPSDVRPGAFWWPLPSLFQKGDRRRRDFINCRVIALLLAELIAKEERT